MYKLQGCHALDAVSVAGSWAGLAFSSSLSPHCLSVSGWLCTNVFLDASEGFVISDFVN